MLLGSIIPDIDHPRSFLGRRLWIFSKLIATLGHRGPTHSLLGMIVTFLILNFFDFTQSEILAMMIGYSTHLLADAMTPQGIPLFYPVELKIRTRWTITTGSSEEYWIIWSIVVLFCLLALDWINFYERLADAFHYWVDSLAHPIS